MATEWYEKAGGIEDPRYADMRKQPYVDPKESDDKLVVVDLKPKAKLAHPVTLAAIKADRPLEEIRAGWKNDLDVFLRCRAKYLIY